VIRSWATIIKDDDSGSILINDDAISYLQKYRVDPDHTVIYADPPYPIGTRSSSNSKYEYDFRNEDHTSLLLTLLQMDCKILISTYPNNLYKMMLHGWNCTKFKSQTRSGSRIELLYYNFDLNEIELHDYRYLGNNFRQRERIKNKIKRHVSRLKRLDRFESLAIIDSIISADTIKNNVTVHNIINNVICR
jgi:hypothetical protein